jgi:hypothetical protein
MIDTDYQVAIAHLLPASERALGSTGLIPAQLFQRFPASSQRLLLDLDELTDAMFGQFDQGTELRF